MTIERLWTGDRPVADERRERYFELLEASAGEVPGDVVMNMVDEDLWTAELGRRCAADLERLSAGRAQRYAQGCAQGAAGTKSGA